MTINQSSVMVMESDMYSIETNVKLSSRAQQAINMASKMAESYNSDEISLEDLLASAQRVSEIINSKNSK